MLGLVEELRPAGEEDPVSTTVPVKALRLFIVRVYAADPPGDILWESGLAAMLKSGADDVFAVIDGPLVLQFPPASPACTVNV